VELKKPSEKYKSDWHSIYGVEEREGMILVHRVRHSRNFSEERRKARQVADFAVKNHIFSSKDVKHIGLKSIIANQILRKYGRNKNIKKVKSVKLVIPRQDIRVDKQRRTISVPCLRLSLEYAFPNNFEKINQIEIDQEYAYIAVTVEEKETKQTDKYMDVDLNTTGHAAVVANPKTGGVWKLGKKAEHIHKKYRNIRRNLQKKGRYKKVKRIRNRENRILRDLNHKMSKKIIEIAEKDNCGIKLEKLEGIRNNNRHSKSFRCSLNSWSFHQLQKMEVQSQAARNTSSLYRTGVHLKNV